MIRHSSSFFISLVIHIILLVLVIITYKTYYSTKKEVCETRICVELRALESKKDIKKPIVKHKKIKQKKKLKKKPKEKKKIKKIKKIKKLKEKKKKFVTKVPKVPIVKEIIEPKIIKEEVIKKTITETQIKEPAVVKEPEVVIVKPKKKTKQELDNERKIEKERITKVYVNLNTQKISKLLKENLYYPRSARKRGITGKIMVKFRLKTNASIENIVVINSNSEILSRAAIKTIKKLSGKFPKPQEDIDLHVPIGYSLK